MGFRIGLSVLFAAFLAAAAFCDGALAAGANPKNIQRSFASPEEAAAALATAAKANDVGELSAILGPDAQRLILSGDEVSDRAERERFVRFYDENNRVVKEGDGKAVLEVGNDGWPVPVPIVETGGKWRFDAKAGGEEILNRRIGRNELSAIQACLAYVDAQLEYALEDRKNSGLLEYAQKFMSDPGRKNGLYWEAKEGEQPSPLGPFAAKAQSEGYGKRNPGDRPSPYHGYFYKILKAQGGNAPGGAHDYVVKGKMIGGFALVAYPAEYGSSGVMTFVVNHDGIVYEKDLGKKSASLARGMKCFDPDKSWRKVDRKHLEPLDRGEGA